MGNPGGPGTGRAAAALAGGSLLIAAVLAGNSLVCAGVASAPALQTPTNLFILSLAAADLLLALLVLPLFVYSEVQGGVWLLGPGLCDALMAMDVLLCTASIFNPQVLGRGLAPARPPPGRTCSAAASHQCHMAAGLAGGSAGAAGSQRHTRPGPRHLPPGGPRLRGGLVRLLLLPALPAHAAALRGHVPEPRDLVPAGSGLQAGRRPRARLTVRERKAMKVLPVVVGAFLLCWTPFFVVHTTRALCPACAVPVGLVSAVTWLGYVNSALNPLIYTAFNAEFRRVFRRTLCLPC